MKDEAMEASRKRRLPEAFAMQLSWRIVDVGTASACGHNPLKEPRISVLLTLLQSGSAKTDLLPSMGLGAWNLLDPLQF